MLFGCQKKRKKGHCNFRGVPKLMCAGAAKKIPRFRGVEDTASEHSLNLRPDHSRPDASKTCRYRAESFDGRYLQPA